MPSSYGKQSKPKNSPTFIKTRLLDENKIYQINRSLHSVNWPYLLSLDTNKACEELTNKLLEVLNTIDPITLKKGTTYAPNIFNCWITKGLHLLIGRNKSKSMLADTFIINNKYTSNKNHISNGFCKYFTGVGEQFASGISPSINTFDHYLKGKSYDKTFYFNPTDHIEIEQIITSLKNKRSCGHDGISSQFLKDIKVEVSEGIAIVINKSLATGVVPGILKIAKVNPIYKSKDSQHCANYRPISLLPVISKLLGKVVHKRLYYMQNMFFPSQ